MRLFEWLLLIVIYPAYVISGGMLFYDIITGTGGLEGLVLIPVFLLFSIISIISPVKVNRLDIPKYVWGFLLWLTLTATTFLTLWSYDFLRNRSREVLTAKFFMELVPRELNSSQLIRLLLTVCCVARHSYSPAILTPRALPTVKISSPKL